MADRPQGPRKRISSHDVKMLMGAVAGLLAMAVLARGAFTDASVDWAVVIALSSIVTGALGYSFMGDPPPGNK